MEGAGAGSSEGGVVGDSGFVCREGGDGDVVYEGELFDGLGEEEGEGEGLETKMEMEDFQLLECIEWL